MAILFITVNDIMALEQVCEKTAYKRMRDVTQHFRLPKKREVSLKAYCKRHVLSEKKVSRLIENHRAKLKPKKDKVALTFLPKVED